MSVPSAFYIPSKGTSDLSILEGQLNSMKTDLGIVQSDLSRATPTSASGTLVRRDANKDFEANKLKLLHLESAGSTLSIAGDNQSHTLNIGSGTGMQTINMGNNGVGSTTIKLGGGTDAVHVNLPLKDAAGTIILSTNASSNLRVGPNVLLSDRGQNNTMIGTNIAPAVTGPVSWNTSVGSSTFANLTTGSNNAAFGVGAGFTLTTGGNNTLIGPGADTTANATNSTALGSGAKVDADNTIQLGNTAVTAVKTSGTLVAAGLESTGNTLSIASNNSTSTVNVGSGTGVQTINVGNNGVGATVINLGGAGDTVNISGTLNNITTTNTQVRDKSLVLNSGGTASTAGLAGLFFEEAGDSTNSYFRVSDDRSKIELKAPASDKIISLDQSLSTTDSVDFAHTTTNSLLVNAWRTPSGQAWQGASFGWNRT